MAVALVRRALTHTCVIAILLQTCCAQKFNIPDVKIEAFSPKGFTASIPEFSSRSGNHTGPNPTPTLDCRPSATRVRGGKACAGQTIFEDNFDSFKDDLWQIEQYIPINHPKLPFVSYQRLSPNGPVSVSGYRAGEFQQVHIFA
ncbi:beta-1,3-glucan-binding protein-like [Ostrinia nubilalis]|uniref:beta-1,3-glucan-binding protein-like n=1 Tax=Ostrinia nubilalis TaxID=29057 RepID=UPI0030825794